MAEPGAAEADLNEDHVDGCTCDLEMDKLEVVSDADLPAATGGVGSANVGQSNEDAIDGCDVDFSKAAATTDEELPVAVGGVSAAMN